MKKIGTTTPYIRYEKKHKQIVFTLQ